MRKQKVRQNLKIEEHPGRITIQVDEQATICLTTSESWELLEWLYTHRGKLFAFAHHLQRLPQAEAEAPEAVSLAPARDASGEPAEYTLYWHPSEAYIARLAYGDNIPLWGSERLEVWHDGRWVQGKTGNVGAASSLVLWPREKAGNPEYITLTVGSRVRNVSEPKGDGGGPEL